MLRFRLEPDEAELLTRPEIAIVAGYTARDRDAIREHILELEELGVEAPPTVPTFYAVPPQQLIQSSALLTTGIATSGEAEAALIVDHGQVFVTICSDHTDRAAERFDIALSKLCCQKVVGSSAWRLDDVVGQWDGLELRSWIGADGTPYQDGELGTLLPPLELLAAIPWRTEPRSFVVLCGTVPTLCGIQPSPRFRAELFDPAAGRRLGLEYSIEALDLLRRAAEDDPSLEPARVG